LPFNLPWRRKVKFTTLKIAIAAAGIAVGAGLAYSGAADDAIKGRQNCMKVGHGGVMGAAVPMFKGDKPFDAAALKAAFDAEDAACADWAKWWGADTQKGETLETWAKAEVWTDAAGFEAAGNAWYGADQKLRTANDEASFKAAFPDVGNGCKNCHEKFRRPKS
jgi:cytochrome c556